jgi:hypothetical protein
MGAYDNPAMIVDTQSGQHVRDMLQSIGNTALQYGIRMAEKREREEKERQKRLENNNTIRKNSILATTKLKSDTQAKIESKNPINIASLQDDIDLIFDDYSNALQRFNMSQYDDSYAGSEQEQADLAIISSTQNFATSAPELFANTTALIDKYKELVGKYDTLGGLDPSYSDPYFQIFVNTQEGAYSDGSIGWDSRLEGDRRLFDYVLTGDEVKKQNAISYFNALDETQKSILFGEDSTMTAEQFASTYGLQGMNFMDVDIPIDENVSSLLVQNDRGGYDFSNEHRISMQEMVDVMNDTDGNPYVFGRFFSEIQDVNGIFTENAEEAGIIVNGRLAERFTEGGETHEKTYSKKTSGGRQEIIQTVKMPNLDEVSNFATQQGGAVTDSWETSQDGIINANATIRKLAKPAYNDQGGFVYDEFGNQVFYYNVKTEEPSDENNWTWSGDKEIKISLLNADTVVNTGETSDVWNPGIKKGVEDFMVEMARRQSGYYTLPVISEKNGDFRPRRSNNPPKKINPAIAELATSVVTSPSGNWSDPAWVADFFNTANLDGTVAMTGGDARLSLQETIEAYEAVDSSKLNKTEKQDLENAKAALAGIDENAIYIQYGGRGDMTEIKIGSAGVVANSIRSSFGSEGEQGDFDAAYASARDKFMKEFTMEKYLNTLGIEATELNLNSSYYKSEYQKEFNKQLERFKRF